MTEKSTPLLSEQKQETKETGSIEMAFEDDKPFGVSKGIYKLLQWQQEAFSAWKANGRRGTIQAATGTGKTVVGLEAIRQNGAGSVLIVVPTIPLQKQWKEEIIQKLGISKDIIGFVGNGFEDFDKNIIIAVVNSIRDITLNKTLLILNEIHHYGSTENIKILRSGTFAHILGLSATPERADEPHEEILKYAPIVYKYGVEKAIGDKVLSPFSLIFQGVELTQAERREYDNIQEYLKANPTDWNKYAFSEISPQLKRAYLARKHILQENLSKLEAVSSIIKEHGDEKIIVFSEFTKSVDALERAIRTTRPCYKYHSNLPKAFRAAHLKAFRESTNSVLISAKAIDEGVNVPDANIGIIIAGSKTTRQTVQRLGRILRKKDGKKAVIHVLYCRNTVETFDMRKKEQMLRGAADSIEWR